MKKMLNAGVLMLALVFTSATIVGCTTQQVQTAETDLLKVLQGAVGALDAVASDPTAIPKAEAALSALAAIAPQTGPIHQAIVNAQAALVSLQNNPGTIGNVQMALQTVIDLLESQGNVPVGAVKQKAFAKKPATKPN